MKRILRLFSSRLGKLLAGGYLVLFTISFLLVLTPTPCQKSVVFPCTLIDVVMIPVYFFWNQFSSFLESTLQIGRNEMVGFQAQLPWIFGLVVTLAMLYLFGWLLEVIRGKNK